MNPRKERQEQIRVAAKYNAACKDPVSFEAGAKWADYNPHWRTDFPKYEENQYGLPKLRLCQCLSLDMTFGYRYTYRVGFITKDNKWNIEQYHGMTVVRWMDIFCNESDSQLIQEDIPLYKKKNNEEEENEDKAEYKEAA